jgi:hypothetical protein
MAQHVFVKLPPFWPHSPALWFSQVESMFIVCGITDQLQRYYHVVSTLTHESLGLVADIVEASPDEEPYTVLKQQLMASHQLTGYQRAEKLFQMPVLGARKPSDLMAAMLKICQRGEEMTELFACLFLQQLPREIRVQWTTRSPRRWRPRLTGTGGCTRLQSPSCPCWVSSCVARRRMPSTLSGWTVAAVEVEAAVDLWAAVVAVHWAAKTAGGEQCFNDCQAGLRAVPKALSIWRPGPFLHSPAARGRETGRLGATKPGCPRRAAVSGMKFLANTGASYSCLPFSSHAAAPNLLYLKGAGGHGITCYR